MPSDILEIDVDLALGEFRLTVAEAVPLPGITAVFGPSGSGKSTLLRVIAGFERGRGRIAAGADTWLDTRQGIFLAAFRRPVGYLFQDARLFEHLSVAGNLRYAARRAGQGDPVITLKDVVAAFDLEALLGRRVTALSGGERQRVALARTLLTRPALLLLDEPLAALDLFRKAEILPYLEALSSRFGVPTLYVSHSIDEVARLADRTLVLTDGRVRAFGPTPLVLERLDVQSIAGPLEASVVIEARVTAHDTHYRITTLDLGGESIVMPMVANLAIGAGARLRIRARDVAVATVRPHGLSIRNVLEGTLLELTSEAESPFAEALLDVCGQHLRARITRAAADDLGLHAGQRVFALVKSVSFDG